MKTIQDVVNAGLCISCGACAAVAPESSIKMVYDQRKGMLFPTSRDYLRAKAGGLEFDICPGKGYPIVSLAEEFLATDANYDVDLGYWDCLWLARSTDPAVLENAASGGTITAMLDYLLSTGLVEGAVVTKMKYGAPGPRTETYIASTLDDLRAAQGSKYCPVPALSILSEVENFRGRLAFVGTPCQVGALRMLEHYRPELSEKFPYIIGGFCGGFRDFRSTDTLIRRQNMSPATVARFRYRGGGQPGSMLMEDETGRVVTLAYPDYEKKTGYLRPKRCRLCVDATAELADFSCGDAWLPRLPESEMPWSLVMTRRPDATRIVQAMSAQRALVLHPVSQEDVKKAQYLNLLSKKTQQHIRRRLFSFWRSKLPNFDGGYPESGGSLALELKAHFTRSVLDLSERIGLYPALVQLVQKYFLQEQ